MAWVLRLVETEIDSPARVIDVMDIRPLGDLDDIAKLGLTLAEAKQGHAVVGYGFFTHGDTPHAAIAQLQARWSALGFVLVPRPAD